MSKVPFFKNPFGEEERQVIEEVFRGNWLTSGPKVKEFEEKFAKFHNVKYAVSTNNGTDALEIVAEVLKCWGYDNVVIPSFTFTSTASAFFRNGFNVYLCDSDLDTMNVRVEDIKKVLEIDGRIRIGLENKTILVVVHIGGQPCNMDEIVKYCEDNSIFLIEDCAHTPLTKYKNKYVGSFGLAGCFSTYATKNLTTGEGGMITTNYKLIYEQCSLIKDHGLSEDRQDVTLFGRNSRMDEIRGAIGCVQLDKLEEYNRRRRRLAEYYDRYLTYFCDIDGIVTPTRKADREHNFHLYTIRVTEDYPLTRDELRLLLSAMGIQTDVKYHPLHTLTAYKTSPHVRVYYKLENAELLGEQVLCLPMYPQLKEEQIEYIANEIRGCSKV